MVNEPCSARLHGSSSASLEKYDFFAVSSQQSLGAIRDAVLCGRRCRSGTEYDVRGCLLACRSKIEIEG